jgi:exopolyphosphatase/guanosine-5'-triphosphate,3'-diphosphate pyrophosphatase
MVESEAQGRLPGIAPVSVVDIGSNSIRLVIYEGLSRSPAILFNEKVMCGLGKGIDATGRMDAESVERALKALHRFRALSTQARAPPFSCWRQPLRATPRTAPISSAAPKSSLARKSAC